MSKDIRRAIMIAKGMAVGGVPDELGPQTGAMLPDDAFLNFTPEKKRPAQDINETNWQSAIQQPKEKAPA